MKLILNIPWWSLFCQMKCFQLGIFIFKGEKFLNFLERAGKCSEKKITGQFESNNKNENSEKRSSWNKSFMVTQRPIQI